MQARLFIDYKEAELSKEEVVAMSYAVNRLSDIQSRQGFYSNTFKLPNTATNRDIFGHAIELNANNSKRWERLVAWVQINGALVVYGFAELKSVADSFEVVVKAGNANWTELLKGLDLQDLNLRTLDHMHNQTIVQGDRFNTYSDGYIYPDIDNGLLHNEVNGNPHWYYFYPAAFVYKLIRQMFTDIGYTLTNELEDFTDYQTMVLPFTNNTVIHSEEWTEDKKFRVRLGPVTYAPISVNLDFLPIVAPYYDNGGNVDTTLNQYELAENVVSQTFNISITYTVNSLGTFNEFEFRAFTTNTSVDIATISPSSTGTFTVEATFEIHDTGNPIKIIWNATGLYSLDMTVDDGYLESIEVSKEFARSSQWNMAENLPDMKQTDLLKYVVNAFCAIIETNSYDKSVRISAFDEIRANTIEDWSDKLDITDSPVHVFEYGDYKNSNILEYTTNTDDEFLKATPDLGKSTVENTHIESGTTTIYKAPFSLVARGLTFDNSIEKALINRSDIDSNYAEIVTREELAITAITTEGTVTVAAGATSLRIGMGVYLYDLDAFLMEGDGFYPDLDFWAEERVFIIGSITSDTSFQLEGDFHYQAITAGKLRAGVMVDKFSQTYVNVSNLGDKSEGDTLIFYDTDGVTYINGDTSRPTNGSDVLIDEVIGTKCVRIKELPTYTTETGFVYATVSDDDLITEGNVRVIAAYTNKDAKPRVGNIEISTDADNAITLFDETTETQVAELVYSSATWDALVAEYWVSISWIIQQPQMVRCLMRLSAADINQLDFRKPKWVEYFGCYFYLSFVEQYKVNEVDSTEVELIKLP